MLGDHPAEMVCFWGSILDGARLLDFGMSSITQHMARFVCAFAGSLAWAFFMIEDR